MHIFDLPVELFHEILYRAIEVRGMKRGLRLRLVNWYFSSEIIQTIVVFRLLEAHFIEEREAEQRRLEAERLRGWSRRSGRENIIIPNTKRFPSFAKLYLERRVLNERADGLPSLVAIRRVAEALSRGTTEDTQGRSIQDYVEELCPLVIRNVSSDRFEEMFSPAEASHEDDLEAHIFIAAIYTRATSYVQRHISERRILVTSSWMFGDAVKAAVANPVQDLLEAMMLEHDDTHLIGTRKILMDELVHVGRKEELVFVYNFHTEDLPWIFVEDREDVSSPRHLSPFEAHSWLKTPSKEVWDFVQEISSTHFPGKEIGQDIVCHSLYDSASNGWTNTLTHILRTVTIHHRRHILTTPLIEACRHGHVDIVKILLSDGVDSDEVFNFTLRYGNVSVILTLLEYRVNTFGALNVAIEKGYRDMVELLLDYGLDVNGYRLEHEILPMFLQEHEALIRLMLERGWMLDEHIRQSLLNRIRREGLESMVALLEEVSLSASK